MPITFGGQQCGDPNEFFDICLAQRMPTEPWLTKVNSFRNPMGAGPGLGYLLLSRASLTALGDLSTGKTLLFDDFATKITLQNITIIETQCLTPGVRSDAAAVYLVTVADRRHRIRQIPAGASYNVRDPGGSGYKPASLNGGTPWTWQEMVDELTDALGIGTVTLPYSPNGKPENFAFFATYAWEALNLIARRLGCGMVYDQIGDTFTMVEVGAADATAVAALNEADRFRAWDADPLALASAKMPAAVNVMYPKFPAPGDGSNPFDVNQQSLATASPYTDSAVYISGDLGSPAESGQNLSTRASERATKWYQAASDSILNPMLRVYTCLLGSASLKTPGKRIKQVAWYDRGDGLKTELYRGLAVCPPDEFDGADVYALSETELCQVTGGMTTVSSSIDVYPAVVKKLTYSGGSLSWTSGKNVWLVQRFNFTLTSGSCFHAKRAPIADYTISGDTRPMYMTTELEWCPPA